MEPAMTINLDDFIDDYLSELTENIALIERGVVILKKNPSNDEQLNIVIRALHTIKGASRMLGFANIEKIAHGMEEMYKGIRDKRYAITDQFAQLTFRASDFLRAGVSCIRSTKKDGLLIESLLETFDKVCANESYTLPALLIGIDNKEEYNTIRIRTDKVNSLVKSVNSLIIRQFQLKKEQKSILELEETITRLCALTKDNQNPSFKTGLDASLKTVRNLKNDFVEKIELIEHNTKELRDEIFSLRMLPFSLILDSIRKMVEESLMKLGKEADLQVSGGDVMLDKYILENINDPLIHLIRNAIDHGIELPDIREMKGKARSGTITIHCYVETGNIILKIKDDGKGLDYDLIRQQALIFAPEQEAEILEMSRERLNAFLFMPGFSTKREVTALSGRGVGLDIVVHNIEKIKGRIAIRSEQDVSTEFILTLPLSLATIEGFFVSAAGETFLIPSYFTKGLVIAKQEDIFEQSDKQVIRLQDTVLPLYMLSSIVKQRKSGYSGKFYVLVVEARGETIAIAVDSVIQYASLIYNPLPANLSQLKAIQGIVFNESLDIVNILYIPEIINSLKHAENKAQKYQVENGQTNVRQILVVDDSYITREIERAILETEHFRVVTAIDGIDGLEKLEQSFFDLVITDINMPRMDGLQMLAYIKQKAEYQHIPVVVISSEQDPAMKQKFINAGAANFIVKSEFDRNNLITIVNGLIGKQIT